LRQGRGMSSCIAAIDQVVRIARPHGRD